MKKLKKREKSLYAKEENIHRRKIYTRTTYIMGNTESSPEELAKTKGGGESFNSLRTFATKSNEKADWSTYDNDDSSVEFIF